MRIARFAWMACIVPMVAALAFQAAGPVDIAGEWTGVAYIPDTGCDELEAVFRTGPDGWDGIIKDGLRLMKDDTHLQDVRLDGSILSFRLPIFDGRWADCRVTVEGDRMTGYWLLDDGDGTLSFRRREKR